MNGQYYGGMAVGVGLGWLNATFFSIPGWLNILLMGSLAMVHFLNLALGTASQSPEANSGGGQR